METARYVAGFHGALPDSRGDGAHCSGRDLQKSLVRLFSATFFQGTQAMNRVCAGNDGVWWPSAKTFDTT